MRRSGWIGVCVLLLGLFPGVLLHNKAAATENIRQRAGEFIIKWRNDSTAEQQAAALAAAGGNVIDRLPELGLVVARFERGQTAEQAAQVSARLAAQPAVAAVAPNWTMRIADTPEADDPVRQRAGRRLWLPVATEPNPFAPNDPGLMYQYAWDKIHMQNAWWYTQGGSSTIIAIVDTGVQLDHPDLQAKFVQGYDFVENDDAPQDEQGHGTHVAGIAAAITNNNLGVAGACPLCRLMPVRVLDEAGSGSVFDVAQGIVYAADNGAQVINLSVTGPDGVGASGLFMLEEAVNYAWNKGAFLACAAGNGFTNSISAAYPAAYPNCVAVGATNEDDSHAYFSNWGLWVDVVAPGMNVYSTGVGSSYTYKNGTSMATPYVAGAAGLLMTQGLTHLETRLRLQETADTTPGTGEWWAYGRLNVFNAVIQ